LLSNELAGKRSDEDDSSLFPVNRSWSGNLLDEPPNLFDVWVSRLDPGQHLAPVEPLADEPARASKSAPAPKGDAAPALSSKLAPNPLVPQVLEPPPMSLEAIEEGEVLVPIEPLPVPTPADALAYSPIVCASACGANSATNAISAPGAISLTSLIAFDLP